MTVEFSSLATLLQQSFPDLSPTQASQLATILQNTTLSDGRTGSQVWSETMQLSAHVDGAATIFYSDSVRLPDGSLVPSQTFAEAYAKATGGTTIDHTAIGGEIKALKGESVFSELGAAIDQFFIDHQITNTSDYLSADSIENAFWRGASEHAGYEAPAGSRFFGTPGETSAFVLNEVEFNQNGINGEFFIDRTPAGIIDAVADAGHYSDLISSGLLDANTAADMYPSLKNFEGIPENWLDPHTGNFTFEPTEGPTVRELVQHAEASAELTEAARAAFESHPSAGTLEALSESLGAAGIALMAYDAMQSTVQAYEQYTDGDYQGALSTITAGAGRLFLGYVLAEAFGLAMAGAVGGPAGMALGFGAGLIGGYLGYTGGDLFGGDVGNRIGQMLHLPGNPRAPWHHGNPLNPQPVDPLVVDLSGNGLQLISVSNSSANIDFGGDGFAERVGWLDASDGFLVVDGNADGVIDVPAELLGGPTQDGFTALAAFDSNHDGRIDHQDADFASLKIWRDLNGNGEVDQGELQTLAEAGLASFSLAKTASNLNVEGNFIAFTALATKTDGSTVTMGSAYFAVDTVLTEWTLPEGFVVSPAADALPQLRGYGFVKDLHSGMTLDATLLAMANDLVMNNASMSYPQIRSAFEAMVLEWTGANAVAGGSRGPNANAQHLEVLEAFYGADYLEVTRTLQTLTDPSAGQGPRLEAAYQELISSMLLEFLAETPTSYARLTGDASVLISSPYAAFGIFESGRGYGADLNLGSAALLMKALAPEQGQAALQYFSAAMPVLAGARVDLYAGDELKYEAGLRSAFGERADLAELAIAFATLQPTQGSAAADSMTGAGGADLMWGAEGNDTLVGGGGNDVYVWTRGDGADVISDGFNAGIDKLILLHVASDQATLVRDAGDLTLVIAPSTLGGSDGGSVKLVASLDDYNSTGIEQVVFADGVSWDRNDLRLMMLAQASTAGNDTIIGYTGDDILTGGHGDDYLNGHGNNDTYIWARGDGNDVLDDGFNAGAGDKVILQGVLASDVTLVRTGGDVTLVIAPSTVGGSDGGSVKLVASLDDYNSTGIEQVVFADGSSWNRDDLRVMTLAQASTSGNDTIVGFTGHDVITGGAGNDTINGMAGDDTYVWARGDGADTITEWSSRGDFDQLVLQGVTADQVTLSRSGSTVTLTIAPSAAGAGDGGSVTLVGSLDEYFNQGIEQIVFADGSSWSRADLRSLVGIEGTAGDDVLNGFNVPDFIFGAAGNDTINGGGGDDVITGGIGNDSLNGGSENDTYNWARGDGADVVFDGFNAGASDKLVLQGVLASEVSLVRDGGDLTVVIAPSTPGGTDGGSVKMIASLDDYNSTGVEFVMFADGSSWNRNDLRLMMLAQASTAGNDSVIGYTGDDILTGGHGDDYLNGHGNNDTYVWARGDGNDVVEDGFNAGDGDKLVLQGVLASEVTLARSGGDVIVMVAPSTPGGSDGGSVRLVASWDDYNGTGVEQIVFGNGTTWSRDAMRQAYLAQPLTLNGGAGNDALTGNNGADLIYGQAGNDTLTGNAGADQLFGGDGADTLNGGLGDDALDGGAGVDVAQFSGVLSDYAFTRINGASGTIRDLRPGAHDGIDTVVDVEQFSFADGVRSFATLFNAAPTAASTQVSSNEDAVVTGQASGTDPEGSALTYQLVGGVSHGTLTFAANGAYSYTPTANYNGTDSFTFRVNDGQFDSNTATITFQIAAVNDAAVIGGTVTGTVTEAAGTGTTSTTTGQLTLSDIDGPASFAAGTVTGTYGQIALTAAGAWTYTLNNTNPTVDGLNAGQTLTDVVTISSDDGTTRAITITINGADDTRTGTGGNDTLVGTSGRDTLNGLGGNDVIDGGAGADTIDGGDGNDTITGGAGNDSITGGNGSDIFVFGVGAGVDTVIDYGTNTSEIDVLKLTNLNAGDITLSQTGPGAQDVAVTIKATGEKVTFSAQFFSGTTMYGIERIDFADGSSWNKGQIWLLASSGATFLAGAPILGAGGNDVLTGTSLAEYMYGDVGNDVISGLGGNDQLYGVAGDDTIDGGAGVDTIDGGDGNDTITGGAGNDSIVGGNGSDTYVFGVGDGVDTVTDYAPNTTEVDVLRLTNLNPGDISLTVPSGTQHLAVTIKATGEKITIMDQFFSSTTTYGVERIDFANGSSWSKAQISLLTSSGATLLPGAPILGGTGNDVLTGTSVAEAIYGDQGNDTISGGDGNDRLGGQAGDDTLSGGNGDDNVAGDAGNDVLTGEAGNDSLDGGDGNDTITGGAGNDTIVGGNGSDIFFFGVGDGVDTVTDYAPGATEVDVLKLTNLNPGDISLSVPSGTQHLAVTIKGTGEKITIMDQFFSSTTTYGVERIDFADGSSWSKAQISLLTSSGATLLPGAPILGGTGNDVLTGTAVAEAIYGDLGNDTISGGDGNDRLGGQAGDDTLSGGNGDDNVAGDAGNDVLTGEAGNDSLDGGDGNDTITGGAGNDSIVGGNGSDIFFFGIGDGVDTVTDFAPGATEVDVLKLTGLNPGDVSLSQTGPGAQDLVVTIKATGEKVTFSAQFFNSTTTYGVERIDFADGSSWNKAQISLLTTTGATLAAGAPILGGTGADVLTGTAAAEFIFGDAGNDTLSGAGGVDTLYGGAGVDTFQYSSSAEAPVTASAERIADFLQGTDKIDLSLIDANTVTTGDQAFTWLGTAAFSSVAGQLRYVVEASGLRTVYGDVNGDGVADFEIQLTGSITLQSTDFVL